MAIVINMPRLSDTMTEGVVATWLKNVGDRIEEGDILAEIETDKATMEFESLNEGRLLYVGIQEGEAAPVDSLLAIIGEEGEDISALISGAITEVKEEKTNVISSAVEKSLIKELRLSLKELDNLTKYEIPKEIYFVAQFAETETQKIQRTKTLELI